MEINTGFIRTMEIVDRMRITLDKLESMSDEELVEEEDFVNEAYELLADIAAKSWSNNVLPTKVYDRLLDGIGRLGLIIKYIE